MMFNSFRTQSMQKLYQTEQLAANLTELAIHIYIHAHTHTHTFRTRTCPKRFSPIHWRIAATMKGENLIPLSSDCCCLAE